MSRMIFVNLPVADITRSRAFFTALGFDINETFSDEHTACVMFSETICAMLLDHGRFADFIEGEIADRDVTETLLALSAESREEVDTVADKALTAGGTSWRPTQDEGFMYGRSFRDLDGHVWELVWMDPAAWS